MPRQFIRIPKACDECGETFAVSPSVAQWNASKFCSRPCYHESMRKTAEARFGARVDRNGGPNACWLWSGPAQANGYGQSKIGGKYSSPHRIAWEFVKGPIPEGLWICHNCPGGDNRMCCNPAHLFLGTPADNYHDMVTKGRLVGRKKRAA